MLLPRHPSPLDKIFRLVYVQEMSMSGVTCFIMPDDMVNQVEIQALTMHFIVSKALSCRPGNAQA
jgi:hypothetical protein